VEKGITGGTACPSRKHGLQRVPAVVSEQNVEEHPRHAQPKQQHRHGRGQDPGLYNTSRGIGAALLLPCSLAILRVVWTDSAERGQAIGIWASCNGIALALGPTVGG